MIGNWDWMDANDEMDLKNAYRVPEPVKMIETLIRT